MVGVRRLGRLLRLVRARRGGAAAPQDAAAGQGRREVVPRRGRRRDEAVQEDSEAVLRSVDSVHTSVCHDTSEPIYPAHDGGTQKSKST